MRRQLSIKSLRRQWRRPSFILMLDAFYTRQQVLLRAYSYCNPVRLSVCTSVTTLYRFKPRWDRYSGFSPFDS